jgi:hypothetical protein
MNILFSTKTLASRGEAVCPIMEPPVASKSELAVPQLPVEQLPSLTDAFRQGQVQGAVILTVSSVGFQAPNWNSLGEHDDRVKGV